jgi:hypothetical protein
MKIGDFLFAVDTLFRTRIAHSVSENDETQLQVFGFYV